MNKEIEALKAHATALELLIVVMARKSGTASELSEPFEKMVKLLAARLQPTAAQNLLRVHERIDRLLQD